jgi:hypothetical protein
LITQLWYQSATTCTTGPRPPGTAVWPVLFQPQHATVPSTLTTQVCALPFEI